MDLDEIEARLVGEGPTVADAVALITEVRRLAYALARIAAESDDIDARKTALAAMGLA